MPYKDKEKARECVRKAMRKYVANHHKMGLCRSCSNPVLGNYSYCSLHFSQQTVRNRRNYRERAEYAERKNQKAKERYLMLKSKNKCACCGMPLSDESRAGVYCLTCSSKRKGYY